MRLKYELEGFAIAARKAIAAGDSFTFEMRGEDWERLRSHVVNEDVPNWASLTIFPELYGFLAVKALTAGTERRLRIRAFNDFAEVQVGSMDRGSSDTVGMS